GVEVAGRRPVRSGGGLGSVGAGLDVAGSLARQQGADVVGGGVVPGEPLRDRGSGAARLRGLVRPQVARSRPGPRRYGTGPGSAQRRLPDEHGVGSTAPSAFVHTLDEVLVDVGDVPCVVEAVVGVEGVDELWVAGRLELVGELSGLGAPQVPLLG